MPYSRAGPAHPFPEPLHRINRSVDAMPAGKALASTLVFASSGGASVASNGSTGSLRSRSRSRSRRAGLPRTPSLSPNPATIGSATDGAGTCSANGQAPSCITSIGKDTEMAKKKRQRARHDEYDKSCDGAAGPTCFGQHPIADFLPEISTRRNVNSTRAGIVRAFGADDLPATQGGRSLLHNYDASQSVPSLLASGGSSRR